MEMDQRAAGETGRLQLSGLEDAPALRQRIEAAQLLSDFRGHVLRRFADLTLRQRQLVVEQALVILQGHYAHLPHKVAMYAINPIRRLELLQARLEAQVDPDDPPAAAFHAEMSDIFNGLRDLHTNYLLPAPYAGRVAFLPFLVEEYFEAADDHWVVGG